MEIWVNAKTGVGAYLDVQKLSVSWVGRRGKFFKTLTDARQYLQSKGYTLVKGAL